MMDNEPKEVLRNFDFVQTSLTELQYFLFKELHLSESLLGSLKRNLESAADDQEKISAFKDTVAGLNFLQGKLRALQKFHQLSIQDLQEHLHQLRQPLQALKGRIK